MFEYYSIPISVLNPLSFVIRNLRVCFFNQAFISDGDPNDYIDEFEQAEWIRRALLQEIHLMNLDYEEPRPERVAKLERLVPTIVYEGNRENLGLLSPKELKYVVKYYSSALLIEDLIVTYRRQRSQVSLVDSVFEREPKALESHIGADLVNRIEVLYDEQSKAIEVLEANLSSDDYFVSHVEGDKLSEKDSK
ncbi:hypothetical protein [Haladaptatus sp. CMSO5]|uniref:hypothetical protein n=1 Tax=Haladaptatus sp. CMSO5 TaxID=3120514 RepID=UPI002FCE137C